MVRLEAVSWDRSGAPTPGGAVRYLFDRACYLRDDAGRLTLITQDSAGAMPSGVEVRPPERFAFSDVLCAGGLAATRGGVLRFAGAALSIDLRAARPCAPPRCPPPGTMRRALRQSQGVLRRSAEARAPEILALLDGVAPGPGNLRALSIWLIGRGPGLTPAGDDYVIGLLAGLWGIDRAAAARAAVMNGIEAAMATTTEIGRTLLEGAMRGVFPGRLVAFADALADRSSAREIERASSRLALFGHSSGICMGLGLLAGRAIAAGSETHVPAPASRAAHG